MRRADEGAVKIRGWGISPLGVEETPSSWTRRWEMAPCSATTGMYKTCVYRHDGRRRHHA